MKFLLLHDYALQYIVQLAWIVCLANSLLDNKATQEKLNIYPYVNGITHTNGGRLINVHERIAIVT